MTTTQPDTLPVGDVPTEHPAKAVGGPPPTISEVISSEDEDIEVNLFDQEEPEATPAGGIPSPVLSAIPPKWNHH